MSSLADSISSFQAFTGASSQEATMFLEMAGNNVEMAVGLFFGGGAGGGGFSDPDPVSTNSSTNPDWYAVIWGTNNPSEAWTEQALTFDPAANNEIPYSKFGLTQSKNGPCGVLAALNAVLVSHALTSSTLSPTAAPTNELLAKAITTLLGAPKRNGSTNGIQCPLWDDSAAGKVSFLQMETEAETENFVLTNLDHFTRPGGLLLICYSVVQSRGVQQVHQDVSSSGGETPLIYGTFTLCTSELMGLLLAGTANGNVGSYGPVGGAKCDWPKHTSVGMLSYNEVDHSIPVCDQLKSPNVPIWILHGRDHFTFCFQTKYTKTEEDDDKDTVMTNVAATEGENKEDDANSKSTTEIYEMYHYNGLPPAGPRMCKLTLTTKHGTVGPAPENSKDGVAQHMTPKVGSIFDVVQAHQEDKKQRSKLWKSWRYEVVRHVNDPDGALYGKGEDYPEGKGPKIYEQTDGKEMEDGRWRCATCYVKRNETMAFRLNDAGTTTCQHCNKEKALCGWTMWMDYEELTSGWQSRMNRRHQPKITTLFGTKFIGAKVEFDDGKSVENPPSI